MSYVYDLMVDRHFIRSSNKNTLVLDFGHLNTFYNLASAICRENTTWTPKGNIIGDGK